jgi:pyruvate kinase
MHRHSDDVSMNQTEIRGTIQALRNLRTDMLDLEERFSLHTQDLAPGQRHSARNLIHYLALRAHDLRKLQKSLAEIGVSSLGRSEGQIMDDIDRVLGILGRLQRSSSAGPASRNRNHEHAAMLAERTEALLGPRPVGRNVRIMVTAPSEAATNYELVHRLLQHGMNCMRINCAYDGPEAWSGMIANLKKAQEELGKPCALLMDIAGPKLRMGPLELGPRVIKVRPYRDPFGRIVKPARVWITPAENRVQPPGGADGCLQLPAKWLACSSPGDSIQFKDARGSSRTMSIVASQGPNRWAEVQKTAYITPDTKFHLRRRGHAPSHRKDASHLSVVKPMDVPACQQWLTLQPGDTLMLTRTFAPGHPATYDEQGRLLSPATASITLPEVFDQVKAGEAIWFDDGKLGGIVRTVDPDAISVEITHARAKGQKLEAEKGINLPDSELRLPAITGHDQRALEFVVKHADLVGYSFVRDGHGVRELRRRLIELGAPDMGIILKIETRKAFECLPDLLLAAMEGGPVGVMIARGDLAIECGFERLAEVQEEILWFAEAAHVPVIWATQVLERLAKDGIPSRAEITDAAMASRAECVMLNKGPFIVDAVCSLDDILRRMESHQTKKRAMMRSLKLATNYRENGNAADPPREKAVDGGRMKRRGKPARAKGERVGIATPFSQGASNTGRPAA